MTRPVDDEILRDSVTVAGLRALFVEHGFGREFDRAVAVRGGVLSRPPGSGSREKWLKETRRRFGSRLASRLKESQPAIFLVRQCVPGVDGWLAWSGLGDHHLMIGVFHRLGLKLDPLMRAPRIPRGLRKGGKS